jgi:hypothetical protein
MAKKRGPGRAGGGPGRVDRTPEGEIVREELSEIMQRLAWLADNRKRLEADISEQVAFARAKGATWSVVGGLLKVSPQAAQKRYGPVSPPKGETPFMVKVWRG